MNDDKVIAVYDNTVSAREYLSYIAEQAGGFAFIGRDGKLYIKRIGESVIDFNIEYFENYTWSEEFRISRIAYEDGFQDFKVGDVTDLTNENINKCTVKEVNEMLVKFLNKTYNTVWINSENMYIIDREQIENIYKEYANFECYSFDGSTIIDPAYDVGDVLVIDGKRVIYQGDMNYVGKFKANISSEIRAKAKEDTMATRVSDKVRIRRVQSSIDQINGEIETLVEEVDDSNEKISQTLQTVDAILSKVSDVANLTSTVNGLKTLTITDAIEGTLIGLRIIGNNVVFSGLYFDDSWCFDENHYFLNSDSTVLVNDVAYDLGIKDVLRQLNGVYDEYVYNYSEGYARVIRRVGVNSSGGLYELSKEVIEELAMPNFELKNGENRITILNYSTNLSASYIAKNDYSNIFATKVELNSEIKQFAKEIGLSVDEKITSAKGELEESIGEISIRANEIDQQVKRKVGNEEIIASINTAIRDGQGIITISGNQVVISSDKFSLTKEGVLTAIAGAIAGIHFDNLGLSYSGKSSEDGFGLWRNGIHVSDTPAGRSSYIIFHAGGNSDNIGSAGVRIYQNGDCYIEGLFGRSDITNEYMGYVKTVLAIGDRAQNAVDYMQIKDASLQVTTASRLTCYIAIQSYSDTRLKKNIEDTEICGLDIINKIRHIRFNWKSDDGFEELGYSANQLQAEVNRKFVTSVDQAPRE